MNVIKTNHGVTDLRRRQMILDYVEQFRTAYNQKNINFLNQVFGLKTMLTLVRVVLFGVSVAVIPDTSIPLILVTLARLTRK